MNSTINLSLRSTNPILSYFPDPKIISPPTSKTSTHRQLKPQISLARIPPPSLHTRSRARPMYGSLFYAARARERPRRIAVPPWPSTTRDYDDDNDGGDDDEHSRGIYWSKRARETFFRELRSGRLIVSGGARDELWRP